MIVIVALMIAASDQGTQPIESATQPDVVVEGKRRVCTSGMATGSRILRARRCRSPEEAEAERQQSRDSFRDAGEQIRIQQALRCSANPMQC